MYLGSWGTEATSVHSRLPVGNCRLHETRDTQQMNDLFLSFSTFSARPPWVLGGSTTTFSCLNDSVSAKLLFTSGGEKRATVFGSEKEVSGHKSLKDFTSESQRIIQPEDDYL